jgi:hypothetical protein
LGAPIVWWLDSLGGIPGTRPQYLSTVRFTIGGDTVGCGVIIELFAHFLTYLVVQDTFYEQSKVPSRFRDRQYLSGRGCTNW